MNIYHDLYFQPAKGEQVRASVYPAEESRSAVCGQILDKKGKPVSGAVALLFHAKDGIQSAPLAASITDSDGFFIFGPLESETLYLVKIFKDGMKLRELQTADE